MLDDNGVIFGILLPGMQSHLSMLTKGIIISVSLARQLMIEPGKRRQIETNDRRSEARQID